MLQDAPLLSQTLALTAGVLLVFVSVAVIYLSTVEWRDRRRRQGPSKT
ncbi:putative conserved membrane protein [Synechococcus sp. PROS-U-1]|nr:putative conserved membrane protein [Synechococcus sp. PROS-U-1]